MMEPEKIVEFKPEDEELTPWQRKRFRKAIQFNIAIAGLNRMDIRAVGGIIAKMGQDITIASHDEANLKNVLRAAMEAIDEGQEKNLAYRRKATERHRKWNQEDPGPNY